MSRVTVLVRGDVVVIRGRDETGAVCREEEVPLSLMTEAHVARMRAQLPQR